MPKFKKYYLFALIGACTTHFLDAMVFDNRFLPLLQRPRLIIDSTLSEFGFEYMFATANKSFDENQNNIPLPEIFGKFNQVELAQSIVATGKPNPLPSQFQGVVSSIPWTQIGKRQMQGVTFKWQQSLIKYLSTGFSWAFMRVNSREQFFLDLKEIRPNGAIKAGDALLLDDNRAAMLSEIGICGGNVAQSGFADIDWYVRIGNLWEYTARFRRIDAGFRLGALMATGVNQELDAPMSIPFGGNGHWGMYGAVDGMFELREDWKVGLTLRINKRFEKTQIVRMPAGKEPQPFGVIIGPAKIDPGATVIFQPYFLLENLRAGLALGLDYTLIWHQKDKWYDARKDPSVPAQLSDVERRSEWSTEYFTLNALYDFGKVRVKREFNPIFTFRWDIPSSLFISSLVPRTQRVSLGIEFVY